MRRETTTKWEARGTEGRAAAAPSVAYGQPKNKEKNKSGVFSATGCEDSNRVAALGSSEAFSDLCWMEQLEGSRASVVL